jgi:hypothetical protein
MLFKACQFFAVLNAWLALVQLRALTAIFCCKLLVIGKNLLFLFIGSIIQKFWAFSKRLYLNKLQKNRNLYILHQNSI